MLASELFKEQTSESTYNIHPDLSQDVHSVRDCVLASQKHLWRIVVARKFEVFRVFDVLCGACRNCIQTALAATDRLGLFLKRGQKVSTYALTCFNHVLEKSSTSESKLFLGVSKAFWFVYERSMNVGGILRIRHKPFIWKAWISSLSDVVSSMHSSPYNTLLFKIESKTRIYHLMVVWALSQNTFNLLRVAIAIAAANLLSTSRWLFALSESSVPKYIASCFRGTSVPSRYSTLDCSGGMTG